MWEITITACSIIQGATCTTASLTYPDEGQSMMPYACMIGGMSEIAKWAEAHPNWSIARWQCGTPGKIANI